MSVDAECGCELPDGCAGLGILYCVGCGGDLCVCACGGEFECEGCDECGGDFASDDDAEAGP